MQAVSSHFEKAILANKKEEGISRETLRGTGTLPCTSDELRAHLVSFLYKQGKFVRIHECDAFYVDVKREYEKDLGVIRSFPWWHPVRWFLEVASGIWYVSNKYKHPWIIKISFEPYNGFLSSVHTMSNLAAY